MGGLYVAEDVGSQGESYRIEASIRELFLEILHRGSEILCPLTQPFN